MSYQALYRKYRSQSFDELIGQDHVVRALRNAISRGTLSHSYLFTGPRGTGKTSTARLLAKALNCTNGPSADPPADDPICVEITAGICMDVLEMDAASEAGVENVRLNIVESIEYKPSYCRYKIFIIDEVHDLSPKAFDALLKTIEEPPAHVIFILATTELNKVPATIKSRCQKYEFHRGTVRELVTRLTYVCDQEGIEYEAPALTAVARMADGGYRDALTLLEQVLLNQEGTLTVAHVYEQLGVVSDDATDKLLQAIVDGDVGGIINQTEDTYRLGRDPRALIESLTLRLADLTRAAYEVVGGQETALDAGSAAVAARLGHERILSLRTLLAPIHLGIRDITLPRQWLESELIGLGRALNRPEVNATSVAAPAARTAAIEPVKVAAVMTRATTPEPAKAPAVEAPVAQVENVVAEPKPIVEALGNLTPDAKMWLTVVNQMSAVSKIAAAKLSKSRVVYADDQLVRVEFDRRMDADEVRGNPKLKKAILTYWTEVAKTTPTFEFTGVEKGGSSVGIGTTVKTLTVESEFEGERLRDEIYNVFGMSAADSGETTGKKKEK